MVVCRREYPSSGRWNPFDSIGGNSHCLKLVGIRGKEGDKKFVAGGISDDCINNIDRDPFPA
jgi:hypothetical protein